MNSAAARILGVITACFVLLAVVLFLSNANAAGIAAASCALVAAFAVARTLEIITGPPVEPEANDVIESPVGVGQQRALCDPFVLHGRRLGTGFSIDNTVVYRGAADSSELVKVQLSRREWTLVNATGMEHPLLELEGHIHERDFAQVLEDALLPWGPGAGAQPTTVAEFVICWKTRAEAGHIDGFALTGNHLMLLRYQPPEAASVDRQDAVKQVRRVYPLISAVGARS